jgi:hypothetical protein
MKENMKKNEINNEEIKINSIITKEKTKRNTERKSNKIRKVG